jgi:Fe2+ or Zn2+ uptake regulation protein
VDVIKICNALSSDKRLKILHILEGEDKTGIEVYKKYNSSYGGRVHRESIYRDLELLQTAGLLAKRYDTSEKKLYYHLKGRQISIDLLSRQISLGS